MYRTTDLSLAVTLKTVLRQNPTVQATGRMAEFTFQVDVQEAQKIADQYYNDALNVNPRTYSNNMRDLKSLIFQARGQ